jgi:cytochrome c oxidase cbb3-type subunit III
MSKNYKKVISLLSCLFMFQFYIVAQETTTVNNKPFDPHWILVSLALILLFPTIILAKALISLLKNKFENEDNQIVKMIAVIIALGLQFNTAVAQEVAKPKVVEKLNWFNRMSGTDWLLVLTILIEVIVIFYLSFKINYFTKSAAEREIKVSKYNFLNVITNKITSIWGKLNNFRPIEQEADLDTGHSYDGIRELDNKTPGWFATAFVLSIIFSIGYLWRYHVAKSAPLQMEEYKVAMIKADEEQQAYLKLSANNVDENNVKPLEAAEVQEGQLIYQKNCAVCHTANGGGSTGPNLTDNFWLHGSSLVDVFKTIKYGYVEKGMKSWKDDLSPKQMAQVANYVLTFKGKNVAGGKAPEGEATTETAAATTTAANTATVVSTTVASDTSKKNK